MIFLDQSFVVQIRKVFKIRMSDYLEEIRTHFNILLEEQSLHLTLINPNITAEVMHSIKNNLTLISNLTSIDIVIIQCPNFDDQLLTILAQGMPHSLKQLSLDFTGCESLRGDGFLQLFEKLDALELTKLSLDFGSLCDINDIVIEGLSLLLGSLSETLEDFYLDLYQVDQITEEGYLLLAEAISELQNLKKFHIDLSANYNLTEDSLDILFTGKFQSLKHFTFKILDSQQIGGGHFFKMAQSLQSMKQLQQLSLTISTFSNLNQKGIYSIVRSIGRLQNLKKLQLNFSNIDMPQKMLTYLNINPSLQEINLDISCNRRITFGDFLNFGTKIKGLKQIQLNLDFCTNITQDVIEQVVQMICSENKCFSLSLNDRDYSPDFQGNIVPFLMSSPTLIDVNISAKNVSKKMKVYQKFLKSKQLFLWIGVNARKYSQPFIFTRAVLDQVFYCH